MCIRDSLDEILRGTNSEERRTIVARIAARLCGLGALGIMTTHDLALAETPELAGTLQLAHFRETIDEDGDQGLDMTFDYVLRDGIAPTTNALTLMRIIGLDEV